MRYRCPLYEHFATRFLAAVDHLWYAHGHKDNFKVLCNIEKYASVDSYMKHVHQKHTHVLGEVEAALPMEAPDHLADSREVMDHKSMNEFVEEKNSPPTQADVQDLVPNSRERMCLLFLKLTEQHKVAHTVSELVFSDVKRLIENTLRGFAEDVKHALLSAFSVSHMLAGLLSLNFVEGIFSSIKSKYHRIQFAEENLPHTKPIPCLFKVINILVIV